MFRSIINYFILFFITVLTACQSTPKPVPEPVAEVNDTDIVMMPGLGGKGGNGLLGVKPMTFEELKACAIKVGQLNKESNRLKLEYKNQEKLKQELDIRNKEIDADRSNVNVFNTADVSKFNKRLEAIREFAWQSFDLV